MVDIYVADKHAVWWHDSDAAAELCGVSDITSWREQRLQIHALIKRPWPRGLEKRVNFFFGVSKDSRGHGPWLDQLTPGPDDQDAFAKLLTDLWPKTTSGAPVRSLTPSHFPDPNVDVISVLVHLHYD